jgi:hypothetical protein
LERLDHRRRQAGGEQPGVDGAGDRRVDGDAGDDRCSDRAGNVGGGQASARLLDEHHPVGSAQPARARERQVARSCDEQATCRLGEQGGGRFPAAGVDDHVEW